MHSASPCFAPTRAAPLAPTGVRRMELRPMRPEDEVVVWARPDADVKMRIALRCGRGWVGELRYALSDGGIRVAPGLAMQRILEARWRHFVLHVLVR